MEMSFATDNARCHLILPSERWGKQTKPTTSTRTPHRLCISRKARVLGICPMYFIPNRNVAELQHDRSDNYLVKRGKKKLLNRFRVPCGSSKYLNQPGSNADGLRSGVGPDTSTIHEAREMCTRLWCPQVLFLFCKCSRSEKASHELKNGNRDDGRKNGKKHCHVRLGDLRQFERRYTRSKHALRGGRKWNENFEMINQKETAGERPAPYGRAAIDE